jgi:hypothetical protein
MSLGDVIASRVLDAQEIQAAVSHLFGILPNVVLVVNDLEELLEETVPDRRVMCHVSHLPSGAFRTVLSFHEGEFSALPRLETVKRLCVILRCDCLISDDTLNPYAMVLVDRQGESVLILLDPDRLDEQNEYVIRSYTPRG